jgi:hypothetical protein
MKKTADTDCAQQVNHDECGKSIMAVRDALDI